MDGMQAAFTRHAQGQRLGTNDPGGTGRKGMGRAVDVIGIQVNTNEIGKPFMYSLYHNVNNYAKPIYIIDAGDFFSYDYDLKWDLFHFFMEPLLLLGAFKVITDLILKRKYIFSNTDFLDVLAIVYLIAIAQSFTSIAMVDLLPTGMTFQTSHHVPAVDTGLGKKDLLDRSTHKNEKFWLPQMLTWFLSKAIKDITCF
ncbi:hypothetical protein ACJX0J_009515 [Zea mays]